ncbi:MAG: MarR family transcriptional regulator [Deltaproteobacteria bacterium]|nr:MAG: MarR family transcriptional regulator [Deltaproteobacteria bacterium]RLC16982.1 MAG: MarR family transcriptional regulator [Deltaproteobacteria bacterium]
MKESNIHIITEQFYQLAKLANKLEKTPRRFGTDEPLTGTEIHLLELIGDNDECLSVTDLSRLLGITKGAVSQNLKRVENKGLIFKEEDPENLSRLIVRLTFKGKTAYFAHKHWHETMDGGFKEYFLGLNQDKLDFLIEFMNKVDNFMKKAMQ